MQDCWVCWGCRGSWIHLRISWFHCYGWWLSASRGLSGLLMTNSETAWPWSWNSFHLFRSTVGMLASEPSSHCSPGRWNRCSKGTISSDVTLQPLLLFLLVGWRFFVAFAINCCCNPQVWFQKTSNIPTSPDDTECHISGFYLADKELWELQTAAFYGEKLPKTWSHKCYQNTFKSSFKMQIKPVTDGELNWIPSWPLQKRSIWFCSRDTSC